MASAISVSRNSVIGRGENQGVSSRLDSISMQPDIDHHFDPNSCNHEVKQVDDNNSQSYNKNQSLDVKLSDFCN